MSCALPGAVALSERDGELRSPTPLCARENRTSIVRVHFSTTSKETFSDKVKRLLRNEVRQLMEQEAAGE